MHNCHCHGPMHAKDLKLDDGYVERVTVEKVLMQDEYAHGYVAGFPTSIITKSEPESFSVAIHVMHVERKAMEKFVKLPADHGITADLPLDAVIRGH